MNNEQKIFNEVLRAATVSDKYKPMEANEDKIDLYAFIATLILTGIIIIFI